MRSESTQFHPPFGASYRIRWNHWMALAVVLVLLAACSASSVVVKAQPSTPGDRVPPPTAEPGDFYPGEALSDRSFYVHDLGHRCLDFGGREWWTLGAPVFIYSCNRSVAQEVRVKEIDESHDVELRVQSLFCIGVRSGQVVVGQPLELQICNILAHKIADAAYLSYVEERLPF